MTSDLKVGDVVQIAPHGPGVRPGWWGCLMVVTEPKSWGAQGYVLHTTDLSTQPARAFVRVPHEAMELIGRAVWTLES